MNGIVQKWGNSLALRIPSALAKDAELRQGTVVEVKAVRGRLVVAPKKERRVTLAGLLKGVTKANRPKTVAWGRPVGEEAW